MITPFQLMTGKILGLAVIGLTVFTIWVAAAFGAAAWAGFPPMLSSSINPLLFVYLVCYASIGAACNTLKEAQSLLMPIMLCIILPTAGIRELCRWVTG